MKQTQDNITTMFETTNSILESGYGVSVASLTARGTAILTYNGLNGSRRGHFVA